MPTLIDKTQVIEDTWIPVTPEQAEALPAGNLLIQWADWPAMAEAISQKASTGLEGAVGVIVPNTTEPDDILSAQHNFDLIAIEFPVFTDGRGYSLARMLREQGYKGELRSVGDVLPDQLFYMARCGFDTFLLKTGKDASDALNKFKTFSVTYQAAADQDKPIYQRTGA